MNLATQVLVGLGLGVVAGVFFGDLMEVLGVAGDAFIMLLQMTVIPYIVVALICGLGRLDYQQAKRLALCGGGVLLTLWAIGLALVFLGPLAYPDWPTPSFFSTNLIREPEPVDFLALYIPANFFHALSNAVVPAIVVFSALIGLCLIGIENKRVLLEPLSVASEALIRLTGLVARLAPFGVFAIVASAAGSLRLDELGRLQVYLAIDILLAVVLSFWILPSLVAALTPLRYRDILTYLRAPLITAFATGSLLIVLPLLATQSKELLDKIHDQKDDRAKRARASVDILIPTFFAFPNLGLVMSLAFALFAGWYVGSSVAAENYPTLAVVGIGSLFGGPVLAIPFLLDLLRLPTDLFHLYVTVDVLSSRFGTLLAAMHLTTIGLIGAVAMEGRVRARPWPLLRFTLVTTLLVVAVLFGLRAFYTNVLVVPYTKAEALAGLELLRTPQPARVFEEPPPAAHNELGRPRTYVEVLESGVLRACYGPKTYPTAYFNASGDLVGFDVEMAHRLARDWGLTLEFVPLVRAEGWFDTVNSGYCDIAMIQVPLLASNSSRVDLTRAFTSETAAFLVPDHARDRFSSWLEVRDRGDLRIAAYDFEHTQTLIRRLIPDATVVPLQTATEYRRLIESGLEEVDAILSPAEEAVAWTILYPQYTVVIPRPVASFPMGYVLPKGSVELLKAVNVWLQFAERNRTIEGLYDYWIQGKTDEQRAPRWSVIRDVLHWVD
ncbi:MAG: cation:dicarboxylase symporter family transporter [Kiloniellales bacterium]|nr:cation:dicarboxylase symporter family transporter [Kiloniellales bacterium]